MIIDHIKMLRKVQKYDPNRIMRSTNYQDFHAEHVEYSGIIAAIKKGWVLQYFFHERTVKEIEEPVTLTFDVFEDQEKNKEN